MNYFAIRHKPSGGFLPTFGSRKGRGGFTHDEPSTVTPPRLFSRRQAASAALTHWLKGKLTVSQYQGYDGDYDESWNYKPILSRKAEDMEIVEVTIRVLP